MVLKHLFVFAILLIATNGFAQTTPKPGVIDATSVDFAEKRLTLNGTWIWYDNKLLSPNELRFNDGVPTEVPGLWNERRSNKSGQGYATYGITLIIPPTSEPLALEMPDVYSSYILFANGQRDYKKRATGKDCTNNKTAMAAPGCSIKLRRRYNSSCVADRKLPASQGRNKRTYYYRVGLYPVAERIVIYNGKRHCVGSVASFVTRIFHCVLQNRDEECCDLLVFVVHHLGSSLHVQQRLPGHEVRS